MLSIASKIREDGVIKASEGTLSYQSSLTELVFLSTQIGASVGFLSLIFLHRWFYSEGFDDYRGLIHSRKAITLVHFYKIENETSAAILSVLSRLPSKLDER